MASSGLPWIQLASAGLLGLVGLIDGTVKSTRNKIVEVSTNNCKDVGGVSLDAVEVLLEAAAGKPDLRFSQVVIVNIPIDPSVFPTSAFDSQRPPRNRGGL